MGLQFLFPDWLWALLLIAIPIIIHLFNFRKYKLVYFTNVHLLKEVKKDTHSKTKLKEWLILLSRILLIAFLAIAFAQPVWVDLDKQKEFDKDTELIIIIDNSFSMSAEAQEGIQLERAKLKAMDIISAYPSATKVMLLTSEMATEQLNYKTKEESISLLSQIKISPFSNDLNKVIKVAEQRADRSISQHLYLISDFQKTDFEPVTELDSSMYLFLIPLESQQVKNISIDTAYFHSPIHNLFENEQLIFSLTNHSKEDIVDMGVELLINDSLKSIANIELPAESSVTDTFYYKNTFAGIKKGRISISDFPVTFDNDLFFNYKIKESLNVGIFSESEETMYLDAFFKENPYYKAHYFNVGNVDLAKWKNSDIILLNPNSTLSSGMIEQVENYLDQHKSLMIFANQFELNRNLWESLEISFLELDTNPKIMASINGNADLFKNSFSKSIEQLDLPKVRYTASVKGDMEWLIKTKSSEVVVAQKNKNDKAVLLFTIPLVEENRQFYTHPLFIPLMYNFMSDAQRAPSYLYSNQINTLFLPADMGSSDQVLHIQKNEQEWIPEQYAIQGSLKLHLPKALESGHYSIQKEKQTLEVFSMNYNRKESVQDFYSIIDLEFGQKENLQVLKSNNISKQSIAANISHSISLWYLCIWISLLFLFLEILLIKYWRK